MADQTADQKAQELERERAERRQRANEQAKAAQNDYSVETNSGAYPQPGQTVAPAAGSDYVGVAEDQTPEEAAAAAAQGRQEQVAENLKQELGNQSEGQATKGRGRASKDSKDKE